MSQRTLGDAKAQARIDEVERAREIGERLGQMDEQDPEFVNSTSTAEYMRKIRGGIDDQAPARQLAFQGLADALKRMLAVFPPEFDEKWAESSGEKIQVQAWNQARAALKAVAPFLEEK